MSKRSFLSFSLIVAVAIALTFFKVPVASSQGLTILAAQVPGDLPATDPGADLWQKTTAVEVPLSAQNVIRPMLLDTKVKSVNARALHNGKQLVILIEWTDDTKNDSIVRVEDFRDSLAVQFPLGEGQPFFCMGQPNGNVNIWHWKADWQADITARQDMETLYPDMYVDQYPFADPAAGLAAGPGTYMDPNYLPALAADNLFASAEHVSPVEDLIAGGMGSITAQPADGQNVQGYGVWADGKWRVIFSRDLGSQGTEDMKFTPGQVYSTAFAAWDGANGERNGQKSTSQWVSFQLEGVAPSPQEQPSNTLLDFLKLIRGPTLWVILIIVVLVAGSFLISFIVKRRQK